MANTARLRLLSQEGPACKVGPWLVFGKCSRLSLTDKRGFLCLHCLLYDGLLQMLGFPSWV